MAKTKTKTIDHRNIPDQEKQDRVILWLTEGHIYAHGGYTHDHEVWQGRVFVADLDDGKERAKTSLQVYELADLVPWYDAACDAMAEEYPEEYAEPFPDSGYSGMGNWFSAFNDTSPGSLWEKELERRRRRDEKKARKSKKE